MKIRFYNARILTMKEMKIIRGELHTEDDLITYVGPETEVTQGFDRQIDAGGDLLMPGFKDAHTHTAMTFARSLSDKYRLDDWLHKAIFPVEAKLTPDMIGAFYRLGVAEYLRNGITSCFDMYFSPRATSDAAEETGFRHVFCGSVNDYGGIDTLEEEYNTYNNGSPLVSYVLGFHAEYTTSESLMKRISDLASKYEAPVYAHLSETEAEVRGCVERYGITPPVLFDKLGLYDHGGGGFHCVHLTDEDIAVFKKRGLYTVFNACSNLKLGSGIAPVSRYIREGIDIAVGTDGAGSNNALDMFREMYLCTVLSNVVENDAVAVDPVKILKAATTGGAAAMGLTDCDCLDAGKKADIIRIDLSSPVMQPENNIINNLVYSGNPGIVRMTMIDGKILYEDGNFTTIDLPYVSRICNSYMEELSRYTS